MTEPTLELIGEVSPEPLHGNIVARGVSAEDYMEKYAEHFYEWVDGVVIKMSPVNFKHTLLSKFLTLLFETYFEETEEGTLIAAPFVMRMDQVKSRREPDLMIILNNNPATLTDTYFDGAADIVIEIVSPGNEAVDRLDKKKEYEQGGVKEYWLFDPRYSETTFYRRNEATQEFEQANYSNGTYTTPLLPRFQLDTALLWKSPLPGPKKVMQIVQAMLA